MALWLDERRVSIDLDGRFIIGFDRDAPPQAVLRADLYDDSHVEQRLAVAPGDWRIERVDAPLLGEARTDEEFAARRAIELEQIAAARAVHVMSEGWRQRFIWPVKARISGRFGSQRVYQGTPGSYHGGLDLAGGANNPYVAPADGVVVLAASEPFTLEGNLLLIDHGMGLNSAFLHSATLLVAQGDVVKQGQRLGRIGMTGRASGPHLHWGMKWGDARIDPLRLLDGRAAR
jgi:murein DD-endopeptidase MepM/ murein hydrolase activator NlpD